MLLYLRRYSYSDTETEGVLTDPSGELRLATIERPWIPNPNGAPGGKPSASCVPDGLYRLQPHVRPNGDNVYILTSSELGVYRFPQDHMPDRGRNLILIHAANWADQVEGCIAPGLSRNPMVRNGRIAQAVANSGAAMARLRDVLGHEEEHEIIIINDTGASDE